MAQVCVGGEGKGGVPKERDPAVDVRKIFWEARIP